LATSLDTGLDAIAFGYETTSIGLATEGGTAVAAIFEIEQERAMARAEAALSIVAVEAQAAGVPCRCMPRTAVPYDAAAAVSALARLYDLTVVLQQDPDSDTFDNTISQEVLFNSGGPVLLVPYTHKGVLRRANIGIAWDGSRLAARAMRDATPLLTGARKITLISVNNTAPFEASVQALKAHLARQGLQADVIETSAGQADIQPTILSIAADESLDLMVMGGYGHSRLKERILGGVTRDMLESMTIPTLMSH
jgi:nucleotide-binding universal stress UspA family protein